MRRPLLAFLFVIAAPATFSQTVFYGGDPLASDNQNYFATVNGFRSRMVTFDDIKWTSSGQLTGLFGYFISNTTFTRAAYELRQGVSAGNGGTLISSGGFTVTSTDLGQSNVTGNSSPWRRYFVEGAINPVTLTENASYHLSIALDFQGNTQAQGAVNRTTGLNGVGSPLANGNLFHDQPGAGLNYSARAGDVSYGMVSTVPEPLSLATLAIGTLALMRRRRRA